MPGEKTGKILSEDDYSANEAGDDHELLSSYVHGGLHPVSLGSTIPFPSNKDRDLRIIHKLGHGEFSTLWLAREKVTKRYVAIEIMVAGWGREVVKKTLAIHELAASTKNHPEGGLATSIENIEARGPNGLHKCFIYHPPLGPDFGALYYLWKIPAENTEIFGHFTSEHAPYPIPGNVELHGYLSREHRHMFARKTVEELSWLHKNGIGHGDFRPMNILNPMVNLDDKTEKQVLGLIGTPIEGYFTVAGKSAGHGQPDTIVRRAIPYFFPQPYLMDKVQLVGFHWSFDINNPTKESPDDEDAFITGYWAPEVIFEKQVGAPAEVWALACTLFEIRVGDQLFYDDYKDRMHDVIYCWCRILGYIPEKWWAKYHEMGQSSSYDEYTMQDILRQARDEYTLDFPEEEIEVFSDLLLKMLRYEKEDRITMAEVLEHPWITGNFA